MKGGQKLLGEEQRGDTPYDSDPIKFHVIKLNNEYTTVVSTG